MFELYYRVVHSEYDDFVGQNVFFQIKCNECKYGEIYPKELETVMDKVSLYDWFERLARVIKYLSLKDYVALVMLNHIIHGLNLEKQMKK